VKNLITLFVYLSLTVYRQPNAVRKTRFIMLLALLVGLTSAAFAQTPNWTWAKSAGGSFNDEAQFVATDASGNVYVAGYFQNSSITFGSTTLTNAGSYDIFIVKYDANGNVLWAKGVGGDGDDRANSITIDISGNVVVVGYFFSRNITFGSRTITNNGAYSDMFIVKYDNNGNVIWAKSAGGSGDQAHSVSTDPSGNIIVEGNFGTYNLTFGTTTLIPVGAGDIFIVKYNSNGNVLWAKSAGGSGDDLAYSVATDALGNVYMAGSFNSVTITFGSTTLTNAGSPYNDIFIVKYDTSGNVLWAKSAGGSSSEEARSVTADATGNFYVVGDYQSSSITFGSTTLTNVGSSDMFVVKYDASGNVLWSKSEGEIYDDNAFSVSTDALGNLYVAGEFHLYPITFGSTTLTNAGTYDMFIVKYDSTGNVLWAKSAGGSYDDWAYSVATNALGNISVVGYFTSSSLTFGSTTLTNVGSGDMFVAKLDHPANDSITYSGKVYHTVKIGSQTWLKENLDIGTMIQGTTNSSNNSTIEKYCYNNDPANCTTYGGLYQWNEAMAYNTTPGTQGICPTGWHIPVQTEFSTLIAAVSNDANALKAIGQGQGDGIGTNTSGFTTLLAGCHDPGNGFQDLGVGGNAFIWSSEESTPTQSFLMLMLGGSSSIYLYNYEKEFGCSIRCLKDENLTASLQLNSPNGSETWQVGSTQNITWTSTGVTNVKLEYTTDNGTDWTTIIASTPASSGSYAWTIPNTPSTQCKVKISDVNNSATTDGSDNVFTINGMDSITYGGKVYHTVNIGSQTWLKENLDIGTMIQGNANPSNNGSIEKYCYENNEANCATYGGLYDWNEAMAYSTTPGTKGICPTGWHIPTKAEFETLIATVGNDGNKLKREDQGTGSGVETNTSGFSALLAGYRANNGYFYNLGANTTFWSSTEYIAATAYSLYLWYDDSNIYVDGNYKGSGFSVRCLEDENLSSSIQIISPNGGESFVAGTVDTIKWTSSNVDSIKIELTTNNGSNWALIKDSVKASLGTFAWIIPNTPSTQCKIRISNFINGLVGDSSNVSFTIALPKSILVTAPNGGENWKVGETHSITWTSSNVDSVKIEFTANNGSSWIQVKDSFKASVGTFAWTVPNTPSSQCKIRISDFKNSAVGDTSNAVFAIASVIQKSIAVTSPNGGENWKVGSSQNITWTSSDVTNVKLEYTTNTGTSWSSIIANTLASSGSYIWIVPNTPSSNCNVRISDVANSTLADTSDDVFTIYSTSGNDSLTYGGKIYHTVQIGTQTWLKENLDIGTMIQGTANPSNNGTIEKYCYNNDPANCTAYGGLYQWNEAMAYSTTPGTQGICPTGWHIPTKDEFATLKATVNNDGNALKAIGQGTGVGVGTNTSGFSALISGSRHYAAYFNNLHTYTYFWMSQQYDSDNSGSLDLLSDSSVVAT